MGQQGAWGWARARVALGPRSAGPGARTCLRGLQSQRTHLPGPWPSTPATHLPRAGSTFDRTSHRSASSPERAESGEADGQRCCGVLGMAVTASRRSSRTPTQMAKASVNNTVHSPGVFPSLWLFTAREDGISSRTKAAISQAPGDQGRSAWALGQWSRPTSC